MTRRKGFIIAGAIATPVICEVAASLLLCMFRSRLDLFEWPFDQWLTAASWFGVNWLNNLLVIVSSVPWVLLAIGVWWRVLVGVRVKRTVTSTLYGNSDWANDKEMAAGGINLRKRPPV